MAELKSELQDMGSIVITSEPVRQGPARAYERGYSPMTIYEPSDIPMKVADAMNVSQTVM
jgi:hypothetical protein